MKIRPMPALIEEYRQGRAFECSCGETTRDSIEHLERGCFDFEPAPNVKFMTVVHGPGDIEDLYLVTKTVETA
jgi:hypothetical protein